MASSAAGTRRSVSVVVPTYREAENLPHLIERVRAVRDAASLDLELILVDDDSRDGSAELVRELGLPWVRIIIRTRDRGLSQAVLEGLRAARSDILVVMDADLSHPPEKIPEMLEALDRGADAVLGSRFCEGGSTGDDWGFLRRLNSWVATLLARPLVSVKDPMSGFFAVRRTTFLAATGLTPIGYKIALELLVKCDCRDVAEVPIHFANRTLGTSKLTLAEQLKYLRHLRRLYVHRYGTWSHLAQFLVVGASGLAVNLLLLTLFLRLQLPKTTAIALSIALSMLWNFALNRRFSFSYARSRHVVPQLVGFVAACSAGAVVNYLVTSAVWEAVSLKQAAAACGVAAGTAFNFLASRFVVFRALDAEHPPRAPRRPRLPARTHGH